MPISSVAMFRRVMASSLRQNHYLSSTSVAAAAAVATARGLVGCSPSTFASIQRSLTSSSNSSPESPSVPTDSSSADTRTIPNPSSSTTSNTVPPTTITDTPSPTTATTNNKNDNIRPKASNPLPPFHVQFEEQSQLQYHTRRLEEHRRKPKQRSQKKHPRNSTLKNQHSRRPPHKKFHPTDTNRSPPSNPHYLNSNVSPQNRSPQHPQRPSNNPNHTPPNNYPFQQQHPQQQRRPSNHKPRYNKNRPNPNNHHRGGYHPNNQYPGNSHHPRQQSPPPPKRLLVAHDVFPQSSYVELNNVPILSSLDDIVRTINEVLDIEKERGIVDLDALEQQLATKTTTPTPVPVGMEPSHESMDPNDNHSKEQTPPLVPDLLPLLHFDEHDNDNDDSRTEEETYQDYAQTDEETTNILQEQQEEHKRWIISAQSILSTKYRPTGWKLQFANRSIVHALLTHAKENTIFCAWKPIQVEEWKNNKGGGGNPKRTNARRIPRRSPTSTSPSTTISSESIQISDSMVRIENCPKGMTIDHLRHVLRRYDLSLKDTPSIVRLTESTGGGDTFLVKFEDSTWARAAIREMQGVSIQQPKYALRFCQYPKQIV